VPGAGAAAAAVSVAALVLLGVAVAGAGGPGPSAAGGLRTAEIGGVAVLTNAQGFALYSFAPDTPSRSNCTGRAPATGPQ
jgi:predicted lipoprotein with Yx(FWY)xxD motif